MNWHTPQTARAFWTDAARLSDEQVTAYLAVARSAVLAFAPLPDDATVIPETYLLAQVMHARNVANAAKGATGPVDPDTGYAAPVTTPLDWHVRQMLVPTLAFGGIA